MHVSVHWESPSSWSQLRLYRARNARKLITIEEPARVVNFLGLEEACTARHSPRQLSTLET
jgi:hypothetical protein